MNNDALTFAQQQEELLRKQLADMYKNQTNIKDSHMAESEARKQELLNMIEQARNPINQQFEQDSRSAYINKMLSGNQLSSELNRMGLQDSGFGLGQQLQNQSAYGSNLAGLSTAKNQAMEGLTNQAMQAERSHASELAGIESNYLQNKSQLEQYINEAAMRTRDNAYNQFIDQQRYQDSMKQQEFQNKMAQQQLGLQRSAQRQTAQPKQDPNFAPDGRYIGQPTNKNPYGATHPSTRSDAKDFGVFGNGYQPKGIHGQGAVKSSGLKVSQIPGAPQTGSTGIPISNQNVWRTENGAYWYWDGTLDRYIRL